MRGTSNRQKDVAGMLRRRQKQIRPVSPLPAKPPDKTGKSPISKNKKS
jgi:hypothetical protein